MDSHIILNYLELLATQSKQIRHNVNGKKKFGFYEDISITGQKQMAIREFCFWIYKSVLVEKINDQGKAQGRSTQNKMVYFMGSPSLIGQTVPVKVTQAFPNTIRGELVQ